MTKWPLILWKSRNNDLPRRKRFKRWRKRRRKPWWLHCNYYQDLYTNLKSQWRKLRRKRKRRKSIPAICRRFSLSLSLSFTHSTFLPIFLPAFIPKIRQIYFSVNRVECNRCWKKKRKKEKKRKGAMKEAREKYNRTIFVSKKRCVEQNDAAHAGNSKTRCS